jgi:putative endonuclease
MALGSPRRRSAAPRDDGEPLAIAAAARIAIFVRVKRPCVYIVASRRNGTLYVGVTSDIGRRAYEHRVGATDGFTKRYGCKRLVWIEPHERMDEAIAREKQIKSGSRKDKLVLIERDNPQWRDLYERLNG